MSEWLIDYRVTYCGTASVEADSAEEARAKVDSGVFDDAPGAERVNWEAVGEAREAR